MFDKYFTPKLVYYVFMGYYFCQFFHCYSCGNDYMLLFFYLFLYLYFCQKWLNISVVFRRRQIFRLIVVKFFSCHTQLRCQIQM